MLPPLMVQGLATALVTLVIASMAAADAPAPRVADADAPAVAVPDTDVSVVAPQLPFGEVPWCSNADDPRCAPADRGAPSGGSDSPTRVTIDGAERPVLVSFEGEPQPLGETTGLSPCAGFLSRVERPPR